MRVTTSGRTRGSRPVAQLYAYLVEDAQDRFDLTPDENERQLRTKLRTQLGWAGLGSVNPTTWVTPWVNREHEAIRALQDLGLDTGSWSFLAETGVVGDWRSLARSAWGLEAIEARYEHFLELATRRRPRTDRQAPSSATSRLSTVLPYDGIDSAVRLRSSWLPSSLLIGRTCTRWTILHLLRGRQDQTSATVHPRKTSARDAGRCVTKRGEGWQPRH